MSVNDHEVHCIFTPHLKFSMIYLTVKRAKKPMEREPVLSDHSLVLQKIFLPRFPSCSSSLVLYAFENYAKEPSSFSSIQRHTQTNLNNKKSRNFQSNRIPSGIWRRNATTARKKLSPVKVTQEDSKRREKRFANLPASPDNSEERNSFESSQRNMSQTPG